MTSDEGLKPEGAPERSPKAGVGAPSGVDGNGPKRFSVQRKMAIVADGKTPQKIVARARIVLLSGRGFGTNSIQREARVSKPTVWRWQKAYMDGGVERLLKEPSPRDPFVRQNAVP